VTGGGRGWLGRVGVGCDYQFNSSFVVGAFGDYDWMSIKGTNQNQLIAANNGTPVQADQKETGAWAVGLRLGYLPYPNLLTFVSGGWTQTRFDTMTDVASGLPEPATGLGFAAQTFSGWFIGGGYEYRLPWWQNLTWKTEYRFADYRPTDVQQIVLATGTPTGFAEHSERFVQTVTTSLVWRFNWGGPVVAKY
jgi:outer membrane immunogenic protein